MIGRKLGQYRIIDRLGAGGMGVIWLAEDEQLHRRVALKMLREDQSGSSEKRIRFEREARLIAGLSHRNIVTLHAIEEIEGTRFLVLEYIEGRTLAMRPIAGTTFPSRSCNMNRATRVPASTVVRMNSASNMMAK